MATTSISITPQFGNNTVTAINCGTSSPKLGGTIDISAFPNLQDFRCDNNDITAISGYENNSNLKILTFHSNVVTNLQPLTGMINLEALLCYRNAITGSLPSFEGLTKLGTVYFQDNRFTGPIPSFATAPSVYDFTCRNQIGPSKITGPIPSLDNLINLRNFNCGVNQITGSIPALNVQTLMHTFACDENTLTGNIPNLSNLVNLRTFLCQSNQLTGFAGGSVSPNLGNFQAQNNQLTQSAVDAILAAFVAAGRIGGTLLLAGTNASPTGGVSNSDKLTLESRGWFVTVTP